MSNCTPESFSPFWSHTCVRRNLLVTQKNKTNYGLFFSFLLLKKSAGIKFLDKRTNIFLWRFLFIRFGRFPFLLLLRLNLLVFAPVIMSLFFFWSIWNKKYTWNIFQWMEHFGWGWIQRVVRATRSGDWDHAALSWNGKCEIQNAGSRDHSSIFWYLLFCRFLSTASIVDKVRSKSLSPVLPASVRLRHLFPSLASAPANCHFHRRIKD